MCLDTLDIMTLDPSVGSAIQGLLPSLALFPLPRWILKILVPTLVSFSAIAVSVVTFRLLYRNIVTILINLLELLQAIGIAPMPIQRNVDAIGFHDQGGRAIEILDSDEEGDEIPLRSEVVRIITTRK